MKKVLVVAALLIAVAFPAFAEDKGCFQSNSSSFQRQDCHRSRSDHNRGSSMTPVPFPRTMAMVMDRWESEHC
jgi:uncharacterized protein YdeI (BOF family)